MTVELKINGETLVDYESCSLRFSMENFAHQFSFTYANKWLNNKLPLPFSEFDPCSVWVDGVKVIDGYIDDVPISYNATTHSISVNGFAWTGHMVDSSAVYKTGSWKNSDLLTLCMNVSEPFGVKVIADPWALPYLGGPFKTWAIEDGETAFEFVARALKHRGLFAISNAERQLVITKASSRVSPGMIELGANVLSANRSSRFKDRHSYYLVKSQTAGTDDFFSSDAAGPFFSVSDPQITVYRPLIVVSDGAGKKPDLEQRANWELTTRVGRSRRLSYTLQGLKTPGLQAWTLNTLIGVKDDKCGLSGDTLLVAAFDMSVSSGGTFTTVELCRPDAFDTLKPPKPKPKKGKKSKDLF